MKKIIVLLVSMLVLVGVGCTSKRTVSKEKVIYMHGANNDIAKLLKKGFEEKYPDVEVNIIHVPAGWREYLNKILTSIAGGVPPDVVVLSGNQIREWIEKGAFADLRPFIAKDEEFQKRMPDFHPQILFEEVTYNGKLYGIPAWQNPEATFYNKDIFDREGIPYPDETWDTNKYREVAIKLTKDLNNDGRVDQYGAQESGDSLELHGLSFFNKEGTKCILDTPEVIKIMKANFDFEKKYSPIVLDKSRGPIELFQAGKLAMFIGPYYFSVEPRKAKGLRWDAAPTPKRGNVRVNRPNAVYWAMIGTSKNKENAWKLIKYMSSPEGQRTLISHKDGDVPILKSIMDKVFLNETTLPKNKRVFVDILSSTIVLRPRCQTTKMDDYILTPEFELARLGEKTVEDACRDAARKINEELKENKKIEK